MERHERCATVPDLIARVVPGKEEDVLWVDRTSRLFCSAGVFAFNEPIFWLIDFLGRLTGTSGSSVQNVWADKPIWLPEMLPFPDELIGDPPKKDEEVGK